MKENIKNKIQEIYLMLFRIKGAPVSPRFLPNYFKKIGVVLIVLTIMFRLMPVYHTIHESFKIIFEDFLILGLFIIAIAKDKVEDEMSELIRLKAMAYGFSFAILYVIFRDFGLILGIEIKEINAQELLFTVLVTYHIICFTQKLELK